MTEHPPRPSSERTSRNVRTREDPDASPLAAGGRGRYEQRMRTIEQLLDESVTIAVVGASANPAKAAHRIPVALQRMGYRVIPVNPEETTLFGVTAYPDLASIPERVDLVDVFRPGPATPPIVQAAIDIGAGGVWLQQGITSPESRALAEAAGIDYVEDLCLMIEAQRLGIDKRGHE